MGDRYFFVHVQKAAGTSLRRQLIEQFGAGAVYPDQTDGAGSVDASISVDHLLGRWRQRREDIRVVTGHYPLCVAEVLDADFATFTLLRHPLARTLSYLRHHLAETEGADGLTSLEAVYDDGFRFEGLIHNHMVKMFSLTPDEMTAGMLTAVSFGPARLERARRRLATVDVVGVQERYEDFLERLQRAFGWSGLGSEVQMNRGKRRAQTQKASDELCERILADNADDVALYEYACAELISG